MLTAGNASLALFNLLPFFPLDGGRVLRALLSLRFGELQATRWAGGVGQVAGVVMTGVALVSGQVLLALIGILLFVAASRERAAATLQPPLLALTAADVAEVPAVELDATSRIGEAIPQLLRTGQEAFPVVADGALLGVVLRGDLVLAAQRPELEPQSIRTLTQQVPELPSHLNAAEALKLLEEMEAPLGVVVAPDYPVGFISQAQVFARLAQLPPSSWPSKARSHPSFRASGSPELPRNPA
jgi:stage IV sporulation protein FB